MKYNLKTAEGREAVRDMVRAAESSDAPPEVVLKLGEDAPEIVRSLLEELAAAEAQHHGPFGVAVREAIAEHLLTKDASGRFRLAGNIRVDSLGVHLVPGRVVVDARFSAEVY